MLTSAAVAALCWVIAASGTGAFGVGRGGHRDTRQEQHDAPDHTEEVREVVSQIVVRGVGAWVYRQRTQRGTGHPFEAAYTQGVHGAFLSGAGPPIPTGRPESYHRAAHSRDACPEQSRYPGPAFLHLHCSHLSRSRSGTLGGWWHLVDLGITWFVDDLRPPLFVQVLSETARR